MTDEENDTPTGGVIVVAALAVLAWVAALLIIWKLW